MFSFFFFQFNNQIWKMKDIFWNSSFYFKSKNELQNFDFFVLFFFLKWVTSKFVLMGYCNIGLNCLKRLGLRVEVNIIRMYKIDFYFFGQLLQENLSYTKVSEILKKNYPNVAAFLVPAIKNLEIKWFAIKIFSKVFQWNG